VNLQLYRIKEASEKTGVNPQTLRNWEEQGLLSPLRIAGDQRFYTESDIEQIGYIVQCKNKGYSLEELPAILAQIALETKQKGKSLTPSKDEETPRKRTGKETFWTGESSSKRAGQPRKEDASMKRQGKKSIYTEERLRGLNFAQLNEIAEGYGISYRRQMHKSELIHAIANPAEREQMVERARQRAKERYAEKIAEEADARAATGSLTIEEPRGKTRMIEEILTLSQEGRSTEEIVNMLSR